MFTKICARQRGRGWTGALAVATLLIAACPPGPEPGGPECDAARPCAGGRVCRAGVCDACAAAAECATGQNCLSGACVAGATCGDGLLSHGEAATDCGGVCGATCAVGLACAGGGDCLFGACESGVCVAPAQGPAPTGEVAAIVTPEGGVVRVVSPERVAVTLSFPAGAVASALEVKLVPESSGDAWVAVRVEPAGTVLAAPATLVVELPADAPLGAQGILRFAGLDDQTLLPSSWDGGARRLVATTRFLGLPGLFDGPAGQPVEKTRLSLPSPASVLNALPLPLPLRIQVADALLTALTFTNRWRDALELASAITAIIQMMGDPEFDALALPWLRRTAGVACGGLADAMATLDWAETPKCPQQFERLSRPMVAWARQVMVLEDFLPASCGGWPSAWKDLLGSVAQDTIRSMESDYVGFKKCECDETPSAKWTRAQRLLCPQMKPALRSASTLPTDPVEWEFLADSVAAAYEDAATLYVVGVDEAAEVQRTAVAEPHFQRVRGMAYASCHESGDQSNVGRLLTRLPGEARLREDAQYCASRLVFEPLSAAGEVLATYRLGDESGPGARTTEAVVVAPRGGRLRLSGDVQALHCPEPARLESDVLVVKVVPGANPEVARVLAAGPGGLFAAPVEESMRALLQQSGRVPETDREVAVEVWRESPGCEGRYGVEPFRLFTLRVQVNPMDPILLGSHDCDPDGCMTETLVRAERSDCAGHSDQWSPLAADAAPPVRLEASERSGGYCRATVRQAWPHEIGWNVDAHAIPFAPFEWGPYPEHRCLSGGGFGTAAAKWVMDLSLETPGTLSWEANPAWISSAGEQGFLRLTIDGGQPPYGAADYSMNYRAGAVGQTQGTTSRTVVQAGTLRLVVELQISPYSNYEARPPATGAGRLFNLTFAASP